MDDVGKTLSAQALAAGMLVCAALSACSLGESVSVEEAASRVRATPLPDDQTHGQRLFSNACAACHGAVGEGSEHGPPMLHPLQARMHGEFAFERAIREGVEPHHYRMGAMPPIDTLTSEEIDAIIGYIRWMQETAGLR